MHFPPNINSHAKSNHNSYTIKKSKRVVEYSFKKYCTLKHFFILSEKKKKSSKINQNSTYPTKRQCSPRREISTLAK